MPNILRRLGINLYTQKEVKSFETYFREREQNWLSQNFSTTGNETESQFTLKSLLQTKLSDYPIFSTNYTIIKAKTLSRKTFIKSDYPELNRSIEDQLEEIGINKSFFDDCFDELYLGTAKLIYFDEKNKIKALPFIRSQEILVKVHYTRVDQSITKIEVLQESGLMQEIDINQPYYILYNQKQGSTYLSNLTIASPYIEAQNKLTQKEVRFIDGDFVGKPIISPELDKILPNKQARTFDVALGGETYEFLDFVSGAWTGLVRQVKEQIQKEKFPILPFGVKIADLTKSNTENQTDKFREWLDDMIIISSLSSASITGKKGTNRAVSEQDRDNLEENTVTAFQAKLASIVNDFVLPILLPTSHRKFKFEFYKEATDESIKLRDQAQKTYEILTNSSANDLLAKVGLTLNKDQVKDIFKKAHGIDLDELVTNVDVVDTSDEIKADYSYGCVMLNLGSNPEINKVKKYITNNNLSVTLKDTRDVKNGIQIQNHITLLYGLLPSVTLNQVKDSLVDIDFNKSITLDNFKVFEKDNYDVLLLEPAKTSTQNLVQSNQMLKGLPYTNDYPDYKPHMTLAYVKKGQGQILANKFNQEYQSQQVKATSLVYSTADNNYYTVDEIKAIDISKVKIPNHIEFNRDILISKNYKDIKKTLELALIKQYEAIANQELKVNVQDVNLFDKYMPRDEFQALLNSFVGTVKTEYNQKIKDLGKDIPKKVLDLVDETVKLTYEGGKYTQIDSKGKSKSTLYKGFENTQKEKLANIEKLDKPTIKQLAKNDIERFESNLFVPLFSETYQEIAVDDGSSWIWTIAKNDILVRPWHLANSYTAHKIGGRLKDNTNPKFYFEPNCRDSRGYGIKQDMIDNNFEIIE